MPEQAEFFPDPVASDVAQFLRRRANVRHTPPPLLTALLGLGVVYKTLADVSGLSNQRWNGVAKGRKSLPATYEPMLARMLESAIRSATVAADQAEVDPKYPADAVAYFRERITEGQQALADWRQKHAA